MVVFLFKKKKYNATPRICGFKKQCSVLCKRYSTQMYLCPLKDALQKQHTHNISASFSQASYTSYTSLNRPLFTASSFSNHLYTMMIFSIYILRARELRKKDALIINYANCAPVLMNRQYRTKQKLPTTRRHPKG